MTTLFKMAEILYNDSYGPYNTFGRDWPFNIKNKTLIKKTSNTDSTNDMLLKPYADTTPQTENHCQLI
jgi:hypothetical protein